MSSTQGLEYDVLTGLYSRFRCRMELQKMLSDGELCVFGSLDIDGFHLVNQRFGSEVGDALLKAVAEALRLTYPGELICRFASDEFCFVLKPGNYSRYEMSMLTRKLFYNLNSISVPGLNNIRFSYSVGTVFVDPSYFTTTDQVYTKATKYRHEAKKHEGNFLYSRYGQIPDIEGAFLILREDRQAYNSINNRLFSIHNEEDWLAFVSEGASLKESMFRRNQGHLDDILTYYKQESLPGEDYDLLFELVRQYHSSLDAFMSIMIIDDILLPHYELVRTHDHIQCKLGHLYLMLADSLIAAMRMGDKSLRQRIRQLLIKTLDICRDEPRDTFHFEPYFFALCEILGHYESIDMQLFSREECDAYYQELCQLVMGDGRYTAYDSEAYNTFSYLVINAKLFPIYRACILRLRMNTNTEEQKQEYQQRIEFIRQHLASNGAFEVMVDDPEYSDLALFLQDMLLRECSYAQILERLVIALRKVHQIEYGHLSEANLIVVAYFFLASAEALIHADISFEEKVSISRQGLNFLVELLRKRETIATDNQLIFLTQVMVQSMMSSPVLSASDKAFYLEQTMAAVTLDTYSHSKAAASYARVILTNIIDHYPQLLVGQDRPYASVEHVQANRESLLQFMDMACMLHDVGKMSLTAITSNAYRRLFSQEFELIRQHTQAGRDILSLDPAFAPFCPFAYSHHRWSNTDGGYPARVAGEEPSPLKILVDILAISDTLEAATSRVGRNYRLSKTFLQILDELYLESGTRYNKEVVQTIIGSPDTYYTLRQMIDHRWQSNYQAIYQEVVTRKVREQYVEQDGKLPNLYAASVHEADASKPAGLDVVVPEWVQHMDADSRQLYMLALIKLNRLSVANSQSIIFYYSVKDDSMSFVFKDNNNQVVHMMGQHYSEHGLGIHLSAEGYQKAMSIMKRVITEPDYPKEGQATIESADKTRCLLVDYTSVSNRQGQVLAVIGQLEDINTSREKLLRTIDRQNQYAMMLDALTKIFEYVVYTDVECKDYELLKGSDEMRHYAGQLKTSRELIRVARNGFVDPEYHEAFDQFMDYTTVADRLKGKPHLSLEYHSNLTGWLMAHIIPAAYDKEGKLTHLIFAAENTDSEHQQKDYLEQVANYDGLTSVLNRTKGEELLRAEVAKGGPQIFALLDCDHFKRINDHLSHLVGDEVLRQQSRVMREVFKDFTIVRLGGDEFVVYLNGKKAHQLIYSIEGVITVFRKFASRIAEIRIPELENIAPTMSCGVVFCNESVHPTFEMLYKDADRALYISKEQRKGTITINEVRYDSNFYS